MKDGTKIDTCGVVCMLRIINDEGGPDAFSSISVRDWVSKETVHAGDATYVIGSNLIPDMLPNIIAFKNIDDARAFREKEEGNILNFTQALMSISPMGMTMPARIKPAILPPAGAFGVGVGYMHMTMDKVKIGNDTEDPDDFIERPGQMMGPKKMESNGEMLMLNYGISNKLALSMKWAYLDKKMEMYKMGGSKTETINNSGFGDIDLTLRYNLWHNTYYSRFFTLLAGTSLPTGNFDDAHINRPGFQVGTGAFSFAGGLLFSHRYSDLWFHYLASYTTKLENSEDYKFGDEVRFGAAVHYTPNYNLMMGLEVDAVNSAKNEYQGENVDNTGGFRSKLSAVVDWKFLTALGGNFSLRLIGGIPIYEDLNHYTTTGMMSMEKVQMGGGYFTNIMINFKRRFSVF